MTRACHMSESAGEGRVGGLLQQSQVELRVGGVLAVLQQQSRPPPPLCLLHGAFHPLQRQSSQVSMCGNGRAAGQSWGFA